MADFLKVAVPAFLALLGTLIGLWIANRKWKRERQDTRLSEFRNQQQAAYAKFWEKLEAIHVKMRTELLGDDEFSQQVRDANSFILQNGIYLQREDHEIANEYMKALQALQDRVVNSKNQKASAALFDTGPMPSEIVNAVRKIHAAWEEVERLRTTVFARVQTVMQAKELAPDTGIDAEPQQGS
jgi:hypothetical protein